MWSESIYPGPPRTPASEARAGDPQGQRPGSHGRPARSPTGSRVREGAPSRYPLATMCRAVRRASTSGLLCLASVDAVGASPTRSELLVSIQHFHHRSNGILSRLPDGQPVLRISQFRSARASAYYSGSLGAHLPAWPPSSGPRLQIVQKSSQSSTTSVHATALHAESDRSLFAAAADGRAKTTITSAMPSIQSFCFILCPLW